jgi:NAD(P)-dependent dehydrogenase (short-subunit alcohol dehydrogenase family)
MAHTVIFGGTKGLSKVLARELKSRGDEVSVFSRTVPSEDNKIEGCQYYATDISSVADVLSGLNNAIALAGNINYLIFCQRYRGSSDSWAGEIEVSLSAPKKIIEAMQNSFNTSGDRAIVFVSSVFGDKVGEGQDLSYHIGKAGINHMSRYFAVNLGRKGVRVNSVTPFTFLKDESKDFYVNNHELMDLYKSIVPLGRIGMAEDSANLIQFLCSPAAQFINGQNIYVDGGLSLVWPETLARQLKSI